MRTLLALLRDDIARPEFNHSHPCFFRANPWPNLSVSSLKQESSPRPKIAPVFGFQTGIMRPFLSEILEQMGHTMFLPAFVLSCLAQLMSGIGVYIAAQSEPQAESVASQEISQASLHAELHANLPADLHSG
jgi:hypothetical protein